MPKRRKPRAELPRRSETADGTTVLTCPTSPGFSTNRGCSTARRCGQNFRVDDGLKRKTGDSFLPPVSYNSEWLLRCTEPFIV